MERSRGQRRPAGRRRGSAGAGPPATWPASARVEVADLFAAAPPGAPSPVIYPLPVEPRALGLPVELLLRAAGRAGASPLRRGRSTGWSGATASSWPTPTWAPGRRRPRGAGATRGWRSAAAPGGALRHRSGARRGAGPAGDAGDRGRVASLTWAEAGDRLRALGDVEVRYGEDGGAEVVNHGAASLARPHGAPCPRPGWRSGWTIARPPPSAGGRPTLARPAGRRRAVVRATGGCRRCRSSPSPPRVAATATATRRCPCRSDPPPPPISPSSPPGWPTCR